MSEMVERLARWYMPAAWDRETKYALEWRKKSLVRAREILALMREPTEAMVDCRFNNGVDDQGDIFLSADGAKDLWRAMLDQALK